MYNLTILRLNTQKDAIYCFSFKSAFTAYFACVDFSCSLHHIRHKAIYSTWFVPYYDYFSWLL